MVRIQFIIIITNPSQVVNYFSQLQVSSINIPRSKDPINIEGITIIKGFINIIKDFIIKDIVIKVKKNNVLKKKKKIIYIFKKKEGNKLKVQVLYREKIINQYYLINLLIKNTLL